MKSNYNMLKAHKQGMANSMKYDHMQFHDAKIGEYFQMSQNNNAQVTDDMLKYIKENVPGLATHMDQRTYDTNSNNSLKKLQK
jgi:hypothetical protein